MGLVFNAPASAGNNNNGQNDNWKATAFVNLWIRRADGSRVKLGAIALRDNKVMDKALIERLQKEDGTAALLQAMEVDFQMATKESSEVNVGF